MEAAVLRTAMAAKLQGNLVYAIAIGAPADTRLALLKAVATSERLYCYQPDPEDLGRVNSEIVGTFGCSRSRLKREGAWP